MSVSIAKGTLSRIREHADGFILQVQDASDPKAATEALGRARSAICNLDAGPDSAPGLSPGDMNNPKYVSAVMPASSGPCLYIDASHLPYKALRSMVETVVRHLEDAGVAVARVASPKTGGPLTDAVSGEHPATRAVMLLIYPPPPQRWRRRVALPEGWVETAASWVGQGSDRAEEVLAKVATVEFPLPLSEAPVLLESCRRTRPWNCTIVRGDPYQAMRGAAAHFIGAEPHLALAAGGSLVSDNELVAAFDELKELARRMAGEVAYAFLSIEPTFATFATQSFFSEWGWKMGGAKPFPELEDLCDELVFDAYPYQYLARST